VEEAARGDLTKGPFRDDRSLEIITLVLLIQYFFRSSLGKKIGDYLPTPFWIYFVPIVLSTAGFLPHESRTL